MIRFLWLNNSTVLLSFSKKLNSDGLCFCFFLEKFQKKKKNTFFFFHVLEKVIRLFRFVKKKKKFSIENKKKTIQCPF